MTLFLSYVFQIRAFLSFFKGRHFSRFPTKEDISVVFQRRAFLSFFKGRHLSYFPKERTSLAFPQRRAFLHAVSQRGHFSRFLKEAISLIFQSRHCSRFPTKEGNPFLATETIRFFKGFSSKPSTTKTFLDTFVARRALVRWRESRAEQLQQNRQYCHPRWPQEEQYLNSEIHAVKNLSLVATSNWWIYFDWACLFLILASMVTKTLFFLYDDHYEIQKQSTRTLSTPTGNATSKVNNLLGFSHCFTCLIHLKP